MALQIAQMSPRRKRAEKGSVYLSEMAFDVCSLPNVDMHGGVLNLETRSAVSGRKLALAMAYGDGPPGAMFGS